MDLDIRLDRAGRALLSHQIGRSIVSLITAGALKSGTRLPATRVLAQQLGVARMTVVDAYGWLAEQGYVESNRGSGTVVREMRMFEGRQPRPERSAAYLPDSFPPMTVRIDFRPGLPDLGLFPRKRWIAALTRSARLLPEASLGYGEPLGHPALRSAVAAYLHRSRGFQVDPRNVIITAGTAQSVDVLLRALPACRQIIVESPGPLALERLPDTYGVRLRRIPVDQDGLQTSCLPPVSGSPRLAYVVPSHQFPLGCVMSVERRLALIDWAVRTGAFVIEDDYDSEFAFNGLPVMPLAKLDQTGRVIYASTFSKTLAPALRIGFMVAPRELLERITRLKWWADRGGWVLQQEALAGWIDSGVFEQHVRRMRRIYKSRFTLLTQELVARLGERVTIVGQPVGMHLCARVRTATEPSEMAIRARQYGVGVYPLAAAAGRQRGKEAMFIFGFGNVETEFIPRGIEVFASLLRR